MVATSATRDARNREEFTAGVRAILGADPEVITGDQEAASELHRRDRRPARRGPICTLLTWWSTSAADRPNSSSETASGRVAGRSVDIGCVRLTERHLHADPPHPAELDSALADVAGSDRRCPAQSVDIASARTLVAVAGTATTVTALALGLPAYDADRIHLSAVALADVERIYDELAVMTAAAAGRPRADASRPGRCDRRRRVDPAGGGPRGRPGAMVASEHDILDGIALSLCD